MSEPTGEAVATTDAQHAFLVDIGSGRDVFAPNPSTMKALRKRGLITVQFIGQRWWWCQPTKAGIAARDKKADQATGNPGPVADAARRNLEKCGTCTALRGDPCRTPGGATRAPHEGRAAKVLL